MEKFLIEKKIKYASAVVILGSLLTLGLGFFLWALRGFHVLPVLQIILLLASGVLNVLYLLPYFQALARDDASRVVPLFQFFPIFVLIVSYLFLHERLTQPELFGFGLVTVGGFLLGLEKVEKKLFRIKPSFWFMMLASFLYGMTGILFKYVTVSDYWLSMAYQSMGMGVGAVILCLYPKYLREFRYEMQRMQFGVLHVLLWNIAIGTAADFAFLYSTTLAPIALVSSMQGTQPVFLLVFGLILTRFFPKVIKEDVSRRTILLKIVSMVLLGLGVWWIYI
jgi:drug/metabolite transporter (DMT)-like permease